MKKFDYRNSTDYSELQKYLDVRKDNNSADVEGIVKDIIDKVRAEGDDALRFYNAKSKWLSVRLIKNFWVLLNGQRKILPIFTKNSWKTAGLNRKRTEQPWEC